MQRFPKFGDINILFIDSNFEEEKHNWETVRDALDEGWDIVAIDSFYELQGIIKEEENTTMKKAESLLLSLIKKHNLGSNKIKKNTTFLTKQQVTKAGAFIGSNRLKHMITAMMELRHDNPKNIYSDRYIVFTNHRRGDVGKKLYYNLSSTGDVEYDRKRYQQDMALRKLQSDAVGQIHDFANKFDKLFNNINEE